MCRNITIFQISQFIEIEYWNCDFKLISLFQQLPGFPSPEVNSLSNTSCGKQICDKISNLNLKLGIEINRKHQTSFFNFSQTSDRISRSFIEGSSLTYSSNSVNCHSVIIIGNSGTACFNRPHWFTRNNTMYISSFSDHVPL